MSGSGAGVLPMPHVEEAAAICVKGGSGLLFPLGGDAENEWPRGLRIVLYMMGLAWCFMGVAIISDVFMSAIEKVTSKKVRRYNKQTKKWFTFEVWNPTVANLTLMALGSSAPEILLNVIDIFAKGFYLEGLGPGTIVGSAAFNLLMIIAVCILAIPDGEIRFIKDVSVYAVTASFSVFAYLWLLIILLWQSPMVVEVWEGVLTFLFFPLMTFVAWCADKGYICGKGVYRTMDVHDQMTPEELAEAEARCRQEHGQDLSSDQITRILAAQQNAVHRRAHYRVHGTRQMFGGRQVRQAVVRSITRLSGLGISKSSKVLPEFARTKTFTEVEAPDCIFEFTIDKYVVLESAGQVVLKVRRRGDTSFPGKVHYHTEDGAAKQTGDYVKAEGWLEFAEGQSEQSITIIVVDDVAYEEDEDFYVVLTQAEYEGGTAGLGPCRATITIIDDDDAGVISFQNETLTLYMTAEDVTHSIVVQRLHGGCGEVSVAYTTESDSALAGKDFEECSGKLVFEAGQQEAFIPLVVKTAPRYDTADRFRLVLSDPQGGARLDGSKDGGTTKNILTITIEADKSVREHIDHLRSALMRTWERSKVGHANWLDQFVNALSVNGGEEVDDDDVPTSFAKVMHIVTLPWKVFFALVPPTDYCDGWVCFFSSLAMIGIVTAVIGDLASLLGCVMCIPDELTAITFVALGTSLPDTFASKTAAEQDPHADASVGNVTGSNSVNVFLGLGLPWMIASIYWQCAGQKAEWAQRYMFDPDLDWLGPVGLREQAFVVPAGSLAFSVGVFSGCAAICITLLYARRRFLGGELGGPKALKWISAGILLLLWLTYIAATAVQTISAQGGASCAKAP